MPQLVVPIFPLPDITFFPGTVLPLHVFEARYRAMLADAVGRDRRLCVVQLRPGYEPDYAAKPAVYDVAGAGEIVAATRLTTGRYDIALRGDMRIRILRELPSDTLYRLVRAESLDDIPPSMDVSPVLDRIRASCRGLLEALGRPANLLDAALASDLPPGTVADRIASAVLPSAVIRQELLETLDVTRRLERVAQALDELVRDLKGPRG
ncbi:MAG: LON peptidase substrate-binding domain-containing protein [Candidatus Rokubacteria bacterium]|nr:LON peptidase substrate-binding domain-containing protein [Candidatus Rokubacteria bacterium]